VRTPVWFAAESDSSGAKSGLNSRQPTGNTEILYVYSTSDSGKAKRIRNSPRARIAPCDMRGRLLGDWVDAHAEIVTGAEAERGMRLLNEKYFPWKQLLDFFASFRKQGRVMFAIRPVDVS
jgi:PPOX class probable F420-dependent enzyme